MPEEEGCVAWCRKFGKAVLLYGGSFIAVACSFVAYDVAEQSKPMKDPTKWVTDFKTDLGSGPTTHINTMVKICAAIALVRFCSELFNILIHYGGVYKVLKYSTVVNMVIIGFVSLPIGILGMAVGSQLHGIGPSKIDGKIFEPFHDYQRLVNLIVWSGVNTTITDNATISELEWEQTQINWIQRQYLCCGMDSAHEWTNSPSPDRLDPAHLPAQLQWWNCTIQGVCLPHTCCAGPPCTKQNHYSIACKKAVLEILIRCLMFSSGLLVAAAVFGSISAFNYLKAARAGIEMKKRYIRWLRITGQLTAQMEDD